VVALDWALSQGSNEVIFANTKGDLCEGSGSNIFLVVDGQLITPTLESGCLAGVTRDLIIEYLGAKEMDVPISTLVSSRTSEAFLASTLRDAQSITHVDETPLHNAIGPVSLRIAKELKELIMDNLNP
ncbi:aminotransferase class IV, partial [mine drainage metagenome]